MKTCVLISGLPRNVINAYNNINDCLIKPNDADVFIHTWLGEDDELVQFITDNFKPKKMIVEKQRPFINNHMELSRMMASHGQSYELSKFVEMLFSSWYSNSQSNLLKEQYRLEHNIDYDYVIRARFDIIYDKPIICSDYGKGILYTAPRQHLPPEMIDDRFAFGSNELMNIYCNGFGLLEYIHKLRNSLDGIFCGETLVYEMVRLFNLEHKIIDGLTITRLHS